MSIDHFPRMIKATEKTAASVGGQSVYELPDKGFLTGLIIYPAATMVSNSVLATEKWRVVDFINDVHLRANGSKEIVKVPGRILNAVSWFNTGRTHTAWWRAYATGTNRAILPIFLGRDMFDPQFSLDLSKFDTVEILVENDSSSTYWSAITEEVNAVVFDQLPPGVSHKGFFKLTQFKEWTTAQDDWEYMDLPSQNPISRIILQAIANLSSYIPATAFTNLMYDIKLKLQSGAKTIFDSRMYNLIHMNAYQFGGECLTSGLKATTADYGIRTGLGRMVGHAGISMSEDGAVSSNVPTISDDQSEMIKPEDREADSPIAWIERGLAPESCGIFDFTRDYPALKNLLEPATTKTVKLDIHTRNASASASGTNRVILEELIRGAL